MATKALRQKIEARTAKIIVVGLGYVGLPLAIALADAGFRVWGVDTSETRVGAVSAGDWPLNPREPCLPMLLKLAVEAGHLSATPDYAVCQGADVVVICVPTPIGSDKLPDLSALFSALFSILEHLRPPALVIVESTLPPYTMEDMADMLGSGFWLAHCPERVSPGRLLYNLRHLPRVIGGYTAEAAELAAALYLHTIQDNELCLTDALTAEVVKCAENAYRDVQIAFVNELAMACDHLGVDVWEVRKLVNTCPGRQLLFPGPGVGGSCLTKDSWLLASALVEPPELMLTARAVNDAMPMHVVDLVGDALQEVKMPLSKAVVTILGVTYRAGTDDVRGSPATAVMLGLSKAGADMRFYDPHVDGYDGNVVTALTGADAAVIITGHDDFTRLNWPALGQAMRHRVLVDTRGIVEEAPEGFVFRGLGRGR